jgi:hypothetical protein
MSGVDVRVNWSLQPGSEKVTWVQDDNGRRSVTIQLDLNRVISLLKERGPGQEALYADAFKAGFLHELGHILYSAGTHAYDEDALKALEAQSGGGSSGTPAQRMRRPQVRGLLEAVWHTLEDARIERRLVDTFRGARRYLEGHPEQVAAVAAADPPAGDPGGRLAQLVALLFLQVWEEDGRVDPARVPAGTLRTAEALREGLRRAVSHEDGSLLAGWVLEDLFPVLDDYFDFSDEEETSGQPGDKGGEAPSEEERRPGTENPDGAPQNDEEGQPPDQGDAGGQLPHDTEPQDPEVRAAEEIEEKLTAPALLFAKGESRHVRTLDRQERAAVRSRIILYPHVDGSMILDEVPVARAADLEETDRTRAVMRDFTHLYGPRALDAFAAEASALRRAFQVNFERRFGGRYRTGKHIGVANVRHFVVRDDLRLFQRIERPDRLSYYFHLLLDVSPSMLTNRNLQKALAVGYAFAQALDRLHVPVDVSLYSSAITELHAHRRDALERFFGGGFGYLSSGTHEIEAIAYAKQQAERVTEERKIIVVTTDGQPNSVALSRTGAKDLRTYYRGTLNPWLGASGIDLLAIGIGSSPSYHPHAVTISSGWESVAVFLRLLDDIIARSAQSHAELWR